MAITKKSMKICHDTVKLPFDQERLGIGQILGYLISSSVIIFTASVALMLLLTGRPGRSGIFALYILFLLIGWTRGLIGLFNRTDRFWSIDLDTVIVSIGAIALGFFLSGQVLGYSSLWGDIGVYVNVARYFEAGGGIPFKWNTRLWDVGSWDALGAPRGMVNPHGDGLSQFHGLPTWPALMALFEPLGTVFRYLVPANVILFYLVVRGLLHDRRAAFLATCLFAFLPIVWHQAIYPTSELLFLTLVLSTAFLLLYARTEWWMIGLGVFSIGANHSSFFIFSAIFGLCLLLIAPVKNGCERRVWSMVGLAAGVGSLAALWYAQTVSSQYMADIVSTLVGARHYLVALACAVPIMTGWALTVWPESLVGKVASWGRLTFIDRFSASSRLLVGGLVIAVLVQAWVMGWTQYLIPDVANAYSSWSARGAYVDKGWRSLSHLSMVNIFLAAGGLGLIGFVLYPFKGDGSKNLAVLWWFIGGVLVVYGVYRIDIPNNFYASRYYLPILVPGLLVFFGWMITRFGRGLYLAIPVLSAALYVDYLLVEADFFDTDHEVVGFVEQRADGRVIFPIGTDWLKFHLLGIDLRTQQSPANRDPARGVVVSDQGYVLGEGLCHSFKERRIPWQISYLSRVQLNDRKICIYEAMTSAGMVEVHSKDSVLAKGGFDFAVFPGRPRGVKVTITMSGKNLDGTKPVSGTAGWSEPKLLVCGQPFLPRMVSAERLVFEGVVDQELCLARLEFLPPKDGAAKVDDSGQPQITRIAATVDLVLRDDGVPQS